MKEPLKVWRNLLKLFILALLWSLVVIFLIHLCIDQNYNDVILHLNVTLSEPNASIIGFEWVLSTRSNEWGWIDIVEDDWKKCKSWYILVHLIHKWTYDPGQPEGSVLVPWWKYHMLSKKSHFIMININTVSFQPQRFPLTQCRDKNYWLYVTLCVVFSLLIYLSHTPTQNMFKLLRKLMTSNLNDRQDYLMINSNSIISNWVQLAVCQIDTEGGTCYVYILHSCIIVKSCCYILPSFMY